MYMGTLHHIILDGCAVFFCNLDDSQYHHIIFILICAVMCSGV